MKRLADGQEPIDLVPVVLVPVQVEVPLVVVPVEVGEVAVAVRVHEVRAVNLRGRPSVPLPVVRRLANSGLYFIRGLKTH